MRTMRNISFHVVRVSIFFGGAITASPDVCTRDVHDPYTTCTYILNGSTFEQIHGRIEQVIKQLELQAASLTDTLLLPLLFEKYSQYHQFLKRLFVYTKTHDVIYLADQSMDRITREGQQATSWLTRRGYQPYVRWVKNHGSSTIASFYRLYVATAAYLFYLCICDLSLCTPAQERDIKKQARQYLNVLRNNVFHLQTTPYAAQYQRLLTEYTALLNQIKPGAL